MLFRSEDIGHREDALDVTFENAQARERTQVLMDLANQQNGLVIGTGDLSELALGWATYNGDHMSMYGVNASVPKTLVRHLVRYEASQQEGELREALLDVLATPVSPELLPPKDGEIVQKTEELVGPYELHDFFLYYLLRFAFAPGKIYRMALRAFAGEYAPEVIKSWLKTFYSKETTEYDAKGNALKETDATDAANKTVTVNVYDDSGNILESIVTEDGLEVSKSVYTYDDDGNILHEKEVSADVVSEEKNTYDPMGRPLKSTDESTGQVTEYTYDYLGRTTKTAVTLNGKTQTSTSSYDGNGTVIKETDTAGITNEYRYDAINRIVERKVTKGDTITYKTDYSYGDVTIQDGIKERTVKNA